MKRKMRYFMCCLPLLFSTAALSPAVFGAAAAKTPADIGPVNFRAGYMSAAGVGMNSTQIHLTGGFNIVSVDGKYQVEGASADVTRSRRAIQKISAKGGADEQVTAVFFSQAEGSKITFLADQAVMLPDPAPDQPGRMAVTFTGHVTMLVADPSALNGVSRSKMKQAVLYLGSGPDYPQVDAEDIDGTATPAPGH